MPLVDINAAGVEGGDSYPWVKKDEIEGLAVAVIQAWGYMGDKFQVCLLLHALESKYLSDGEECPEIFAISFDAESPDNPRRKYLAYFSESSAEPLGPVALQKIEARNQQGWVWALRACPIPTEALEAAQSIQRNHYRQDWRRIAAAEYRRRQALAAQEERERQAAALAAQARNSQPAMMAADASNDLPF